MRVRGRRASAFRLTAARAHLVADVDGMVDEAVDASRTGGLPGRVWRGLTGAERRRRARGAGELLGRRGRRFVRHVKRPVDRPARDADVSFETASLPAIPSQTGLKLNAAAAAARWSTAR